MRTGITGSRSFTNYEKMNEMLQFMPITEIITRGSIGTELLAEQYGREQKIFTRSAKDETDEEFVKYCNIMVIFWDGKSKGTQKIYSTAQKLKIPITIIWI